LVDALTAMAWKSPSFSRTAVPGLAAADNKAGAAAIPTAKQKERVRDLKVILFGTPLRICLLLE
jgi:hypothetical protein